MAIFCSIASGLVEQKVSDAEAQRRESPRLPKPYVIYTSGMALACAILSRKGPHMEERARVLREVRIDHLLPAHFQARQSFPDEVIAELAGSMKEVGQNSPILVRPTVPPSGAADGEDWFQLVCGECRFRAATQLGWTKLWAVIEEMDDETAAIRGMVDNEQRRSLNPIERALGYQKLMSDYHLTQEQLAERSSIAPPTLSRLLGLLDEPTEIQEMLKKSQLTEFHCRSLDRLVDRKRRVRLAREVVEGGISAKETARRVTRILDGRKGKGSTKKKRADLATEYNGFWFRWEGDEVVVRARNLRPGNSVDQYIKDFRQAMLGFLQNEPRPILVQPTTDLFANAPTVEPPAPASTAGMPADPGANRAAEFAKDLGAQAREVADSLKPLGSFMRDFAKTFAGKDPSKK